MRIINLAPGKVLDIINPTGNLQPREMARGEGRGNAGSCEGLVVSMETHQERGWVKEPGVRPRENGFTKGASRPGKKRHLEMEPLLHHAVILP